MGENIGYARTGLKILEISLFVGSRENLQKMVPDPGKESINLCDLCVHAFNVRVHSHGTIREEKIYITIRHTLWYETIRPESQVKQSSIEFIRAKASKGPASFQILYMLRSKA